ncbi:DUF4395 domain-containing protein [Pedobacter terrae]|uniref:DUF4395 domain-containing protein n=1 Tax=Pedobacter terrae TaxID=405671 RepID=UPI002FFCEF8A
MELSCPVSAERINENVVRIIAFMVAVIAISCVVFSNYWAIVFLLIDFALRAFTTGKFSILKFVAIKIADVLSIKPKMKDLAPKKFAAAMGFGFCLLITLVFMLNFLPAVLILTLVLTVFALLESLFSVCVGCYVYTFINLITKNKA